jgi:hypothetical protein
VWASLGGISGDLCHIYYAFSIGTLTLVSCFVRNNHEVECNSADYTNAIYIWRDFSFGEDGYDHLLLWHHTFILHKETNLKINLIMETYNPKEV